jgi:hypothetical protein
LKPNELCGDGSKGVIFRFSAGASDAFLFLQEDQEMRLGPRKTHKPPVDLRLSGQPAQSALEKAWRVVDEERRRSLP